jgi:hypothetical protein
MVARASSLARTTSTSSTSCARCVSAAPPQHGLTTYARQAVGDALIATGRAHDPDPTPTPLTDADIATFFGPPPAGARKAVRPCRALPHRLVLTCLPESIVRLELARARRPRLCVRLDTEVRHAGDARQRVTGDEGRDCGKRGGAAGVKVCTRDTSERAPCMEACLLQPRAQGIKRMRPMRGHGGC